VRANTGRFIAQSGQAGVSRAPWASSCWSISMIWGAVCSRHK